MIAKYPPSGKSKSKKTSLRHIANAVKTNQIIANYSDGKDALVLESYRITSMNSQIRRTENAVPVRNRIDPRLSYVRSRFKR